MNKIAYAGFLHESNSFAPYSADLDDFVQGGGYIPLSRGDEILTNAADVNLAISGGLQYGVEKNWTLLPSLWAGAIPSAPLTYEAYESLTSEIIDRIASFDAIDGIFLDLHGAMMAEHVDDGEGELLERLRKAVGYDIPIVCALDLHGNITKKMFALADGLVGFRTYPHIDMKETGYRAAKVLDRLMQSKNNWHKAMRRADFLTPIAWQCTSLEPAASLYKLVEKAENSPHISSVSLFMGFPAADFDECGATIFVYGDDINTVEANADRLLDELNDRESAFKGKAWLPSDAVNEAMSLALTSDLPIIIADTQDNPGAGGSSDTTGMIAALVNCGATKAAIGLIVDAQTVAAAHKLREGDLLHCKLGGKSGIMGDQPFEADFTIERLFDAKVKAQGAYFGGTEMDLGPAVCLLIGDVRVVVTTHAAQMADRAFFQMAGIIPEEQNILVVKSSVHFRADFTPIAQDIIVATAPGSMPLSPASFPWKKLRADLRVEPNGAMFSQLSNV